MLFELEKILSKNKDKAYWNARNASKKEFDSLHLKYFLFLGLFFSIFIIFVTEHRSQNLDSYFKWSGVVKEIVNHGKFGIRQQDTFEYIVEYAIDNESFTFSKIYLGTPTYQTGQSIPLLVYKSNHSISQIDGSIETVQIISTISTFIFLAALLYTIKRSPKVTYTKPSINKKRGL